MDIRNQQSLLSTPTVVRVSNQIMVEDKEEMDRVASIVRRILLESREMLSISTPNCHYPIFFKVEQISEPLFSKEAAITISSEVKRYLHPFIYGAYTRNENMHVRQPLSERIFERLTFHRSNIRFYNEEEKKEIINYAIKEYVKTALVGFLVVIGKPVTYVTQDTYTLNEVLEKKIETYLPKDFPDVKLTALKLKLYIKCGLSYLAKNENDPELRREVEFLLHKQNHKIDSL